MESQFVNQNFEEDDDFDQVFNKPSGTSDTRAQIIKEKPVQASIFDMD